MSRAVDRSLNASRSEGAVRVHGSADIKPILLPSSRASTRTILRLGDISDCFPESWLDYGPSPTVSHIEHTKAVLLDLGVIEEGDASFSGFCGVPRYFHPRADPDALSLSLELITWYFSFDEPFDEGHLGGAGQPLGQLLVDRMVRVLEGGTLPPEATGCERLCHRFRERAKHLSGHRIAAWHRFIRHCSDWAQSILPIDRRTQQAKPDLAAYNKLRLVNVGIMAEYALNEIIYGLDLDPAFLADSRVTRFGELAALVIAYCNDVYSYEKERLKRTQLNSLELRLASGGLTLEEAYRAQVADIRTIIGEMVALEEGLHGNGLIGFSDLRDSSDHARARRDQTIYLDGIKAIVVGNHLWSVNDGRYESLASPFYELQARGH